MKILQMNTSKWARWTENRFNLSRKGSKEEPCKNLRITSKHYTRCSKSYIVLSHTFPANIWTANCITQPQTYYWDDQHYHMSRLSTKATKSHMRQAASAQSNQSLRCPHEESFGLSYPQSGQRRLIRLGWCQGWSAQSDLSLRWAHMSFI